MFRTFAYATLAAVLTVTSTQAAPSKGTRANGHVSHNNHFGYLFANFYRNNEQVFFQLSDGNDPLSFSPLNNNKPVVVNDEGSKAIRDPFIAYNPLKDKYWLIGNNQSLIALGIDKGGDFGLAYNQGYNGIVVSEALDNTLTQWGKTELQEVAGEESLHVFAPEAIWDPKREAFLLHWSGAYKNQTVQKIYGRYTQDFHDFGDQFVYYEESRNVADMTIAAIDDGGEQFVRFWQSEVFDGQVRGQYSVSGLDGPWKNIKSIAVPNGGSATINNQKGGSGVSVYRDNKDPKIFYILVNEDAAEVPYQTDDIKVLPYKYADTPNNFPRGTSQGSVINLKKFQYDALRTHNFQDQENDNTHSDKLESQGKAAAGNAHFNFVPLFPQHKD
ncbi:unnamed protein product [Sympodiomycopsis kandeliae]